MTIVVNALSIAEPRSGVGHYVHNLLRALLAIDRQNTYIGWFPRGGTPADLPAAPNFTRLTTGGSVRYPVREVLWECTALPLALSRRRADLFFSPSHTLPPFLPAATASVVMIHDLSFLRHPETKTRRFRTYMRWMVRRAVRGATLVVVNSEFTQREVLAVLGAVADRVVAIPLAPAVRLTLPVSPEAIVRARGRWALRGDVVLAVGDIEPRKNLGRLVEAVALLKRRHGFRGQLVVAGRPRRGTEALDRAILTHELAADVVLTGYVPDDELAALYRLARVCVYTSLYEGFGLPPLEAMACGTPVVASKAGAIPEVVGDAALLVDPASAVSISEGIARVLSDARLAAELVACGHARARHFTWERTAQETLRAFEHAVELRRAGAA